MSAASNPPAAVTVHFYDCDTPSRDELVDAGQVSHCEVTLLDWLDALTVATESWRPQSLLRTQLSEQVATAQVNAVNQCLASRFPPEQTPKSGVAVRVASQLRGGGGGSTVVGGASGLKALIPLRLSSPTGNGSGGATGGTVGTGGTGGGGSGAGSTTDCPQIPFHVLHWPVAVGGNTYLHNTVMTAQGTPPTKNGSGELADTAVFSATDQTLPWSQVIHKLFTNGSFRISSSKVFNHWVSWDLIRQPAPSAALEARGDAFDLARMRIDLPGFPQPGAQGPRWLVVHRYSHSPSGRSFWFAQSITPESAIGASWPITPDSGRGYSGSFTWRGFDAPDEGEYFDPAGTWTHESGVVDFAMTEVAIEVRYDGELCAQATRTIGAINLLTAGSAPFVAEAAAFRETVELRTIKSYKAAFRLVEMRAVNGIGIFVRLRLVNELPFATCMVVVLPLGGFASRAGGGRADPVIVRNLGANSQSDLIEFLLPMSTLPPGTTGITMQGFASGISGGKGIVGLALPSQQIADGIFLNKNDFAAALVVTSDGQRAEAWGFYGANDTRYWHQPSGVSSVPLAQEVFAFDTDPGVTLGSQYATGLTVTVIIRGEKKVAVPGVTRSQFPTGGYYVKSGPGYTGYNYSPRYCPSTALDQSGSNLQTIGFALTSTANGVTSVVASQDYTGDCYMNESHSAYTSSQSYWLFDNGQGYKIWTWPLGGPYSVAWDIIADMNAITVAGNAQYEAARWRWDPFEDTRTASMSRETYISRYGRRFSISSVSADGHGTTTLVGDWANASAVEQYLVDGLVAPYNGSSTYRGISTQVTKHPTLVLARTGLAEADYPGGIPTYLDGQLHALLQNGTNVVEVIWT